MNDERFSKKKKKQNLHIQKDLRTSRAQANIFYM